MKYSEKDKDRLLASYYYGDVLTWHGSEEIAFILKGDGYLETLTSSNGIVTRITDKGRAFYLNGGYVGEKGRKDNDSRKEFKRNIITAIIGSVSGFIAGILANLINT